jgi:hypothetical protein
MSCITSSAWDTIDTRRRDCDGGCTHAAGDRINVRREGETQNPFRAGILLADNLHYVK